MNPEEMSRSKIAEDYKRVVTRLSIRFGRPEILQRLKIEAGAQNVS